MIRRIFLIVLLTLLAARFYIYFSTPKPFEEGDVIKITTRIISEPTRGESFQYVNLLGLKVYLPSYPEVFYGDTVTVQGKVSEGLLVNPKVLDIKSSQNALHKVRSALINFFERSLPRPYSSLMQGMVLGSKSGITKDFWERLRKSGTAHVVVASGMNVSLVASFLTGLLSVFGRRKMILPLTVTGIWMYAVLSGFDAPIVRACVMATVTFAAQITGRMLIALKALFASAFIMLFINPGWIGDLGFLLSFFATLSLILFEKNVNRLISRLLSFKGSDPIPEIMKNDLSTSVAAQIGVAPILFYYFGSVNIFSPFINMLILWTVAPITVLGMIGGMLGLVFEPLGKAFLYLAFPLTFIFAKVVEIFS